MPPVYLLRAHPATTGCHVRVGARQPTCKIEDPAQKPARRPLDEKLPRERIVHAAPCTCRHCGSAKIRKLDEKVTETLEHVPAAWKVIQHVREVFTCRDCERITETPVPSHPIARGRAGPQLLAEVLHNKYRAHLPLNRQRDLYAAQGVDLDVSTLAERILDDGRLCLSNNAAERALRGIAVGRKNWTFCGSNAGGHRAAAIYTLIETCKLNGIDARTWLADVLARIADHPAKQIADLLPWNWKALRVSQTRAA